MPRFHGDRCRVGGLFRVRGESHAVEGRTSIARYPGDRTRPSKLTALAPVPGRADADAENESGGGGDDVGVRGSDSETKRRTAVYAGNRVSVRPHRSRGKKVYIDNVFTPDTFGPESEQVLSASRGTVEHDI